MTQLIIVVILLFFIIDNYYSQTIIELNCYNMYGVDGQECMTNSTCSSDKHPHN